MRNLPLKFATLLEAQTINELKELVSTRHTKTGGELLLLSSFPSFVIKHTRYMGIHISNTDGPDGARQVHGSMCTRTYI